MTLVCRIARVRYVLPRRWVTIWAANWVGRGRGRKSTRPGANGVVELLPFEFLDRLADLVPPPRKHRHRYHGVFAPNHKLRRAVTALAIGNVGKRGDTATDGHARDDHATGGCCDANPNQKPRSHDTSRIAWAKLMARVGEGFPLECPNGGGGRKRRRRHPADRVRTVLPVRNHPWPSHSWQPPVATDILSASRGRSGKSSRILANRSSRYQCRPLVARPPTGASSCRSMTIATSFKPRPTNCPRSTSTGYAGRDPRMSGNCELGRGLRRREKKTPPKGVRGVSRNPLRAPGPLLPRLPSRSPAGRPLRKCH
ncbi:MAG: hypothetical protein DWI03_00965 [Planctomycetota bacterium]|nr:MAG: hypothetical protein DWI03_00965 [Planctomycetota bacterium]